MKKIVYILVAALAVCFASCEKENDVIVFKATAESPTQGGKTSVNLVNGRLSWMQGDAVKIKCENGTNWYTFVNGSSSSASEATFTCPSADATGFDRDADSYQAVYPAELEDGGVITLPSEQKYVANNISGFPMYTVTTNDHLSFKNTCGVLKLNVKGNKKVKEIILSSSRPMCGTVTVGGEANNYLFSASGATQVSLDCGSGVQLTTSGTDFYIYLPQDYYTGLTIQVLTDDGYSYTRHAATSTGLIIERNTVTTLPFTLEGSECEAPAKLNGYAVSDDLYYYAEYTSSVITGFTVDCEYSGTEAEELSTYGSENIFSYVDNAGVYHLCTPAKRIYVIENSEEQSLDGCFSYPAAYTDLGNTLTSINFGDNFYVTDERDMNMMFEGLLNLEYLYLGRNFNIPTNYSYWYDMFYGTASGVDHLHIYCNAATKDFIDSSHNDLGFYEDVYNNIIWHVLD